MNFKFQIWHSYIKKKKKRKKEMNENIVDLKIFFWKRFFICKVHVLKFDFIIALSLKIWTHFLRSWMSEPSLKHIFIFHVAVVKLTFSVDPNAFILSSMSFNFSFLSMKARVPLSIRAGLSSLLKGNAERIKQFLHVPPPNYKMTSCQIWFDERSDNSILSCFHIKPLV